MSTSLGQLLNHQYQRRMLPFQVRRQEPDDTEIGYRSIKAFKTTEKAVAIQRKLMHGVAARNHSGSAAAFEPCLGWNVIQKNGMRFEEGNGQKRDLFHQPYGRKIRTYLVNILFV